VQKLGGGMAAAAASAAVAAAQRVAAAHSATAAERLQQRGCCRGQSAAVVRSATIGGCSVSGATKAQQWRAARRSGVAASVVQPKPSSGAQRDGGSAVGAARRLRRIHRHRL